MAAENSGNGQPERKRTPADPADGGKHSGGDAQKPGGEHATEQKRQPLTPAKRKRLQKCFEHAGRQLSQNNFDYATTLLQECVAGDPDNLAYLQTFFGNLHKKYGNNKKGSKLASIQGIGSRGSIKKCQIQKDWDGVLKHGIEILKLNPWDTGTLCAMATACDNLGYEQTELVFLRNALETDSKSADINRQCAISLAKRKQYKQAIACWHRVEQAKPGDEEAQKAIADLTVEMTIQEGRYEEAGTSQDVRVKTGGGAQDEIPPEERLEKQIAKKPNEIQLYIELAQLHYVAERYHDAEQVLERAYKASGEDADIREKWEDAQLRRLRHEVSQAEKKAKASGSADDRKQFKALYKELTEKEIEVYQRRVERYPNNLTFKFELGQRYKIAGNHQEAIKMFQAARNDPRKKGLCILLLGESFEKIGKARMALRHYEEAVQEIPERDEENKKRSLYRAGKVAILLSDKETAEKYLNSLAAMDFGYLDVAELLDQLETLKEGGAAAEAEE